MKRTILAGIILLSLFFNACNFNQSVNKDMISGAYSRGDGISCDEVVIQVNGKNEKRNHFVHGEKVNFVFNNISGFKKEGGKIFPGLSLFITKNEKDTVLTYPDLLKDLKEGTALSPIKLQANFIAVLPYRNKEKYKVKVSIWDKKGEGTFLYELPFTVEENELLNIDSKDINYSHIYLWNESLKQPVLDNQVNQENQLALILEGLDGLTVKNGNVYPVLSIALIDNNGNKIISDSNVLSKYELEGINAEAFTEGQLPVTITFSSGQINNPCKLVARLKDKNSDKKLNITTELKVK
ncbi:hypothetical protein OOZ15_09160 [Galbibacter sp. EGI 63066]|uniref:hypothetical protein n=1 Tax=Galbibacter sp. EGI 63066 TaxID=2993559 RepID=UPI0022498680|nr:hypothetical protein [Galbibacter sp. EGI 63066]MCX2680105.1 hypothetical protein [Galbibacter sp. EGI 63066]